MERPLDGRMVAPQGEYAEASQHVEVPLAGFVVEVGTLATHVDPIEADRSQEARHLRVQVRLVQLHPSARALGKRAAQREWLGGYPSTRRMSAGFRRVSMLP